MYRKIFYRLLTEYKQYEVGELFFRLFYLHETHFLCKYLEFFCNKKILYLEFSIGGFTLKFYYYYFSLIDPLIIEALPSMIDGGTNS